MFGAGRTVQIRLPDHSGMRYHGFGKVLSLRG
jgi:hypothetical protein